MEEIDAIIIDSLKHLNCDLDQDITSLKQFDADMIVASVSRCLEAIIPNTTFPKKIPPSMSVKLKVATNLATQIKDLGFRDDIGYQTILYCNEAEIRRVFMFLIERLPREPSKVAHVEQTGYVPTLVKEIEHKVKNSVQQFWVPSCVLHNGYRKSENGLIFHSLGSSCPLHTVKLQVPCNNKKSSDDLREYWIRNVPVVTKQCDSKKLIPSLLFQDSVITTNNKSLKKCFTASPQKDDDLQLLNSTKLVKTAKSPESAEVIKSEFETKLQSLLQELKTKKEECLDVEKSVESFQSQLENIKKTKSEEEETLQKLISQINLKSKTLTVASKEENLQKLKDMIEASKKKMVHLTEQWNQIQAPLLEEYNSLQNAISSTDLKKQQERDKLKKLQETYKSLTLDLQEKTQLEEQLRQKLEQMNKGHTRSGYTRRILEIIGNIKKQDEGIQKILKDTREVQREINSLTGQVDRSFTLADELIFRDAKHDETARKAYKLLAQLRDDCSNIIKAVADLGAIERECRNLQEQIDTETTKESAVKLERVTKDLQEIKKETELLQKQKT